MSEATAPMPMTVVDAFLGASLLSAIGDDERRYQAIRDTVRDLTNNLSNNSSELLRFSRLAFEPNPDSRDPALEFVYDALKANWKLIDNVFPQERPVTLLRVVMLEVIAQVCEDERAAAVVYHANISAAAHRRYGQAEGVVVSRLFSAAGEKAEAYTAHLWDGEAGDDEEAAAPEVSVMVPKSVKVDVETLQDALVAAVGPNDRNNTAPKASVKNTNWPHSGPPWSYEFPPIAAPAIATAIRGAVMSSLNTMATATTESLNTALQELVEDVHQAHRSAPRPLQVLWWMQALYSPTVRRSYRDLEVVAAATLMPHDLLDLNIMPCPEGVVHVLGEAARNAVADHEEAQRARATVSTWLGRLGEARARESVQSAVAQPAGVTDDASLLGAARAAVHGLPLPGLGELGDAEVTPRQLAMWLLRDLVAERLAESV